MTASQHSSVVQRNRASDRRRYLCPDVYRRWRRLHGKRAILIMPAMLAELDRDRCSGEHCAGARGTGCSRPAPGVELGQPAVLCCSQIFYIRNCSQTGHVARWRCRVFRHRCERARRERCARSCARCFHLYQIFNTPSDTCRIRIVRRECGITARSRDVHEMPSPRVVAIAHIAMVIRNFAIAPIALGRSRWILGLIEVSRQLLNETCCTGICSESSKLSNTIRIVSEFRD